MKRQWTHAQKNPSRALSFQFINSVNYWNSLNHLPEKAVKLIVNNRILAKDKETCDNLLSKIYQEKQKNEEKKNIQTKDREKLRERLRFKHKHTLQLEKESGVRLGMSDDTQGMVKD